VIQTAAKERPKRPEMVHVDNESVPAWALYEQGKMLEAVNLALADRNRPPVQLANIQKVEHMAMGHVDYASKFALYCTEIVLDGKCHSPEV
jgi:hypothetical protein